MSGHFPTPLPDELFYSLCARYSDRVRYSDIEAVNKELFGARGMSAGIDLPSHLGHLVKSLPTNHELTVNRLINEHTLSPFYTQFLPVERYNRVREDMEGIDGSAIHNCAGITPSNVRLPDWLRYCRFRMYCLIMLSLPCLPTVLMKSPSVRNSPPHSFFLTPGHVRRISRAVMLLIVWTIRCGLSFGTDCTRKCTWSPSVPISRNVIS